MPELLKRLCGQLIVSCQPVPGGPLDRPEIVVGFARAALDGGAAGLRVEGVENLRAVRAATRAPVIGLVKRDLAESAVRITPFAEDVADLCAAGADVVAFDATRRRRPVPVGDLVSAAHAAGVLAMADCANAEDARAALAAGADIVASTLSGYTDPAAPEPAGPDLALVAALRLLTPYVIAEGRIRTPEEAARALAAGAWAVVVGSAITRPEHVTAWFCAALAGAEGRKASA